MGVNWPTAASAMGGNYGFRTNWEWPNTFSAILEFGPGPVAKHGFVMQYSLRMGCTREARAHGKCFLGSQASLLLDRDGYAVVAEPGAGKKPVPADHVINAEERFAAADDEMRHLAVFLENLRQRKQPFANCETGHAATNVGHLMNISWQAGRSIRWDGRKEQVVDDPQAQALVMKPYRAPWKLDV